MSAFDPILRVLRCVEEHLEDELKVIEMAEMSGYSLYHFCRTFSNLVHIPPYEYLMRRRLSAAAEAVMNTEEKLVDIAYRYQFSSPEVFLRAFKRTYNQLPSLARRNKHLDIIRSLPAIQVRELEFFDQGINHFAAETVQFSKDKHLQGMLLPLSYADRFNPPHLLTLIRDLNVLYSGKLESVWGSITWVPLTASFLIYFGVPDSEKIPRDLFSPKTLYKGTYKKMRLYSEAHFLPECLRWLILLGKVRSDTEEVSIYFRVPFEIPLVLYL